VDGLNHAIVRSWRSTRSPKGREPKVTEYPVIVRGRESRPHGEGGSGWSDDSTWMVRAMRDAETVLAINSERRGKEGRGVRPCCVCLRLPYRDTMLATNSDAGIAGSELEDQRPLESRVTLKVASTVRRGADGKGAAGCPSLPTHHGLTNPGISRELVSRLPY